MQNKKFIIAVCLTILLVFYSSCKETQNIPSEYEMNEQIIMGEWKIEVIAAEEYGTELTRDGATFWSYEEGHHMLFVQIHLENTSEKNIGNNFLNPAFVRDTKGKNYEWWKAGPTSSIMADSDKENSAGISINQPSVETGFIFLIPDGSEIVEFTWDDFPAVLLSIEEK